MTVEAVKPAADDLDLADVERRIKAIFIGSVGNLVEWYGVQIWLMRTSRLRTAS